MHKLQSFMSPSEPLCCPVFTLTMYNQFMPVTTSIWKWTMSQPSYDSLWPYIIIIESFYSLWSMGHPWRASGHCDLQLSLWPRSMIFLCFFFHPLLSFATFSSAYLFFYIPEDSYLMRLSRPRAVFSADVCWYKARQADCHLPYPTASPPTHVYRVIQEESALLWEMIVWVILSKKVHTNMGPILNGYGVMGIF